MSVESASVGVEDYKDGKFEKEKRSGGIELERSEFTGPL